MHATSLMFSTLLLAAPFIVFGEPAKPATVPSEISGVFGLHPDLVKLGFFLLFSLALWLFNRAIGNNTKNMNMLYSNQRELAKVLTQLTTAHNINHGQVIDAPNLSGGETEL